MTLLAAKATIVPPWVGGVLIIVCIVLTIVAFAGRKKK